MTRTLTYTPTPTEPLARIVGQGAAAQRASHAAAPCRTGADDSLLPAYLRCAALMAAGFMEEPGAPHVRRA